MIQAKITKTISIGDGKPLLLIGGPLVMESQEKTFRVAEKIQIICDELEISFVFKSSINKSNRSSISSFRGIPLEHGIEILRILKKTIDVPILTDIQEVIQANAVAEVADILQIPALLCRQTDLLLAASATGRAVSVKKGQFLAPWDMENVVQKLRYGGAENILLVERGVSFGYGSTIVDFRALPLMRDIGHPVVFDITNSLPKSRDIAEIGIGNQKQFMAYLARAAVAVGCDALFLEIDEPNGVSNSSGNTIFIDDLKFFLKPIVELHKFLADNTDL
jgi:2-dehydro-3-deoxyphosphooctonate aldolase (KDO 8-P synthase)